MARMGPLVTVSVSVSISIRVDGKVRVSNRGCWLGLAAALGPVIFCGRILWEWPTDMFSGHELLRLRCEGQVFVLLGWWCGVSFFSLDLFLACSLFLFFEGQSSMRYGVLHGFLMLFLWVQSSLCRFYRGALDKFKMMELGMLL